MKIAAYVQSKYAKQNYKNECMDSRMFAGLHVIMDALNRAGYDVEYCTSATVNQYDLVLVSLTSDCDWWSFITERIQWSAGRYKVAVGGAGVLHVTPFLRFADYFLLGRGEDTIVELANALAHDTPITSDAIIDSATFSDDSVYHLAQVDAPYPHSVELGSGKRFQEGPIGCNHRCMFCGYTWQRKHVGGAEYYMRDNLFGGIADKERAMLDMAAGEEIDFARLRTTAIDGISERLRAAVNKRITDSMLREFLLRMTSSDAKPHQVKLYNIVGYPCEGEADYFEFLDALRWVDERSPARDKQWSIVLHCTPFRAMPATPMACAPMSKLNYRGYVSKLLGPELRGNLIYQGKHLWCVEGMGTDSLATVMLSAIAHRGGRKDTDNIIRLCSTPKFWTANSADREATLEHYFDMDTLFGAYTANTLPSRYLRTYCAVERCWPC